jgi:regulatory protein
MEKPKVPTKPIADYATALLAHRDHSTAELRSKLAKKGYPKAEIAPLLTRLTEQNYLNDTRTAAQLARHRAQNSKWGMGKIRQELSQKGLRNETAQAEHEVAEHDWLATATKLLQRRHGKPLPPRATPDYEKERARRLNFLLRRGFSMSQACEALRNSGVEAPAEMP